VTEGPLSPLDPELAALLEVERSAPVPAAALERVWTHVSNGTPPGAGTNRPRPSVLARHGRLLIGTAFVVGTAIGATGYALLRPPSPARVVYVERPTAPASDPVPAVAAETSSARSLSPAPAVPELHAESPSAKAATARPLTLSAERALLDDARGALAAGDAARALSRLDEHVRRFPKPRLAEEREALAIQALVLLKRYDEARERAAHFKATTPNSLFLPAIDTSLSSIP
jgi:hypothetical protein